MDRVVLTDFTGQRDRDLIWRLLCWARRVRAALGRGGPVGERQRAICHDVGDRIILEYTVHDSGLSTYTTVNNLGKNLKG